MPAITLPAMEDLELWKNIKNGNKTALKKIQNKYYYQMYLYAIKSTHGDSGLAEELVSDSFIKLWEKRKKIEIETSFENYLFFILKNRIIDHFRKKRILTKPLINDFIASVGDNDFDGEKHYARLYKAVKKLPKHCRKVLEMAVYESMTYQEIADNLNISRNTVKTQMGRAYKQLREMLDPKDFNLFLIIRKRRS